MITILYAWLTAQFPTITFCPVSASESASYPVVVYQLVKDSPQHDLAGELTITESEIRIEVMSLNHAEVDSLGNSISDALDGFRGVMGSAGESLSLGTMTLDDFATLSLDSFATLPLNASAEVGGIGVIVRRLDGGDSDVIFDPSEDAWVYVRRMDYQIRWKNIADSN
jgi:hypothetical protein